MIYFDNLQAYATNSTHSITEAVKGVMEVANAHIFETRERQYLLDDGDTYGQWSRSGNAWTNTGDPGTGQSMQIIRGNLVTDITVDTQAVLETEGSVVVDVQFADTGMVLFGAGGTKIPTYGMGVCVVALDAYNSAVMFLDHTGVVYQYIPLPESLDGTPYPGKFRIVLHEITTAKLEIEYKLIVVYQGLKFVGAQAYFRNDDQSTELMYIRSIQNGSPSTFYIYADEFAAPALEHSVDPGETPQASFNRTTTGLAYKMAARYNTHIKFYKPLSGMSPVMSLNDYRDLSSVNRSYNYDERFSRVRAVSAYPEAEYIDPVASDQAGGQFVVTSNPNIISLRGAAAEAERLQNQSDSYAETLDIEGPSCLILEPDDLVTVGMENWIAVQGDRIIGANGMHMSTVRLRKYVEGT